MWSASNNFGGPCDPYLARRLHWADHAHKEALNPAGVSGSLRIQFLAEDGGRMVPAYDLR